MEFRTGRYLLASLLVEGQFPDYRSVVPKDLDAHAIVEREAFVKALTEVKKYTSIESQATRLTFLTDSVECRCKSPVKGMAHISVPLQTVPKPEILGFDPDYLLMACEQFKGSKWVALEFKDQETGVIVHAGEKAKSFHLVMPIDI